MRVSLDFSRVAVITRQNAAHTLRLRSDAPIAVDGTTLTPGDNGVTDLDLTPAQSEALSAMIAEGIPADVAASGVITLPDGGSRGKPLATGPSLASFVRVEAEAEAKPKGRKTA